MHDLPEPIRKFFCDDNGRLAIAQRPNALLWIWLVCAVLSHVLPAGAARDIIKLTGRVAIVIWAVLEIYSGASYFRRTLGLIVMAVTIVSFW